MRLKAVGVADREQAFGGSGCNAMRTRAKTARYLGKKVARAGMYLLGVSVAVSV